MTSNRTLLRGGLRAAAAFTACALTLYVVAFLVVKAEPLWRVREPGFMERRPQVGDAAPDFTLGDIDGGAYRLRDHLGRRPVVIEFGSASCPYCTGMLDGMSDLTHDFGGQADFVFVYCQEAHPDDMPPTTTLAERLARARDFARAARMPQTVLVDDFDSRSVQGLYGAHSNSAFILGADGRVVCKLAIGTPREIDAFLRQSLTPNRPDRDTPALPRLPGARPGG
jgi:hypothetical protein